MASATKIEDLSDEALLRAYNAMAGLRGTPTTTDFPSRKTGEIRTEAILEIVAATFDVVIGPDGAVTATALPPPGAPAPVRKAEVVAPRPMTSEPRVSPGIARMREKLGADGAEALRRQVEADGEAALAVAAKRETALEHDAGGDAAEARAASARGPGDPARAAQVSMAVSLALQLEGRPSHEVEKRLSKEVDPQAREILKNNLAEAKTREAARPASDAAPAPRKAPTPRANSKTPNFDDRDVIRLKVPGGTNPKRSTAATRFAKYVDGGTFGEYATAIGDRAQAVRDVVWDSGKGWLAVEPVASEEKGATS